MSGFRWPWSPAAPETVPPFERGTGTVVAKIPLAEGLTQQPLLPGQTKTRLSHTQLRVLAQHPVVWTAMRTMIAKAQGLDWSVTIRPGAKWTSQSQLAALAAAQVLTRPNTRFRTFAVWLDRTLQDFYVSGNTFHEVELSPSGPGWPVALWNLPADQIAARQVDQQRNWVWEQQTPSGRTTLLNPEEIIWASRGVRYDLSGDTLAVIQEVITRLAALDSYIGGQFSTLGMLAQMILHFPGAPDEALEGLRQVLNQRKKATAADEVIVTAIETYGGDAKNLITRPSNKESDLLPYRETLERQVWAFFGGTALQAGIPSGQNRAIAAVSRQEANEGIFKGDMETIEDMLTGFCQLFHPDLAFEFPTLDTLDPLSMARLYAQRLAYMTLNEVRRSQSLADLPEGDVVVGVNGVSTQTGIGQTPGAPGAETTEEVLSP